ncbi:hypothetical protein BC567DRAFT_237957 [Phyllosticta citribraziliensis]
MTAAHFIPVPPDVSPPPFSLCHVLCSTNPLPNTNAVHSLVSLGCRMCLITLIRQPVGEEHMDAGDVRAAGGGHGIVGVDNGVRGGGGRDGVVLFCFCWPKSESRWRTLPTSARFRLVYFGQGTLLTRHGWWCCRSQGPRRACRLTGVFGRAAAAERSPGSSWPNHPGGDTEISEDGGE